MTTMYRPVTLTASALMYRAVRDGYVPGGVAGPDLRIAVIDAAICAEAICENCGHVGLEYRPYVRSYPCGYRIVAACPTCNAGLEL